MIKLLNNRARYEKDSKGIPKRNKKMQIRINKKETR